MKRLFIIVLFLAICQVLSAQTVVHYDREKLLELYQSQRYAEAAQYLQTIYPDDIQDVKVLGQLAYCYMMAGKLPEAEKIYFKIISLQPRSISVLFSLANINLKRGNEIKAKVYFESIVQLDSLNFTAYKQLANLYKDDTDSQKVVYLIKANQLNPIEGDVAYDLAIAYKKLKNYEPAYRVLTIAIAADTGNLILQQAKLPIAIQLKRYKEVISTGEKLLTGGTDANVAKDVGMAYFYLKSYEKAIKFFNLLETFNAANESSLYYTSLCYRNLNNYKAAALYAKKAIEEGISTNTSSYYLLLGGIYEIDKQLISAVSAYKKGLTFNSNIDIFYRLGLVYDKLDKKKNAETYYRLYLKSKPNVKTDKEQIDYVRDRMASKTGLTSTQN